MRSPNLISIILEGFYTKVFYLPPVELVVYITPIQHKKILDEQFYCSSNMEIGSSSWARTSDIMINSHALCQLSYRGIFNFS